MEFLLINILNGLQLSMMIFLLAGGLTLIFGLMDVLNLAHGGIYTIGAYVGLVVAKASGSFWIALMGAPLICAIMGAGLEIFVFRPLIERGRSSHLDVALLTFGLLFVIMGLADLIFGPNYASVELPPILKQSIPILGFSYPAYRLFIILAGFALAFIFWLVLERTVIGAVVRAGVDNRDMVLGMGINIKRVFILVFAAGTGLAGLAGIIAAPVFSVYSRMGAGILIITLIVVVVAGLGNIRGSFYASLLVGMIDTFTQAYFHSAQLFALYLILALLITLKPQGIFAKKGQTV